MSNETTTQEKVKVRQVRTEYSEAGKAFANKTFDSVTEFDRAVSRVTPPKMGYYKTDFVIEFEDGKEYRGRIDINAETVPLAEHVRWHAELHSGRVQPKWMDDNTWAAFKRTGDPSKWEELLDGYAIE